MMEKIKKHKLLLLGLLIIICIGIILGGGIRYLGRLRVNLENQALQNVMTVTKQQQQAFDAFISGDRDQLHGFVKYFTAHGICDPEEVRDLLTLPDDEDAVYSVICFEERWFCSNTTGEIRSLDDESLEPYRSLTGSGVRDSFIGFFTGAPRFGFYEAFTFSNGHKGLVQKSYDRSKVSDSFSLSFYNDRGLSHLVNQDGEILLRPASITENLYDNILDALTERFGQQEGIDHLMEALRGGETGSIVFSGDSGELVYTYVPMETVQGWSLVSVVSMKTIAEETDQILLDTQTAMMILVLLLFACVVSGLLIWVTQRDLHAKDKKIDYQEQLFEIFTTYLSQNTSDMYMLLDHETEQLEYVSPNVERVLGVSRKEAIRAFERSDMEADPEAAKVYYDEINALTPGEASKPRRTERVNEKTGEHRYFLENAYCATIQDRVKRVVYISDRTKEHQAQNSLAEALRMAQAANKAKSTFLSSVSHDIRTPMNAIIGFLALLRDEADHPDLVREYTQRIDAASQHLLGLINDVLDMNKIESGSATLNLSDLNLAEIIDEINTIIRPQARAKNQTFDIFVSHLNYEHLQGDKLRLNQILINLLSNAVKYTPADGTIQMRVEELPQVSAEYSRVRFTVRDNGMGMSEEYQKIIFDPFTREETQAVHEIQGTGLGMAITKSLVDLMGGTIRVESELNQGSTFTVELELRIREREDDPRFWSGHGVSRMIVADGDGDICRGIVKTMSKVGVETDYATDGGSAVEMMRAAREAGRPYDLILLDWKTPSLDGLETARLIRKNDSQKVPILLLTAYDWSEIEQEAMEIGVSHYMPKPFFMSTFRDAVRRVMGGRKQEKEGSSGVVRGRHILVVDDIEVNRIILVKILSTLGASCDTAGNGQEAAEQFGASAPGTYDLILMDVQMPVMDGYTATRTIRGSAHPEAKTIPIIAMTANAFVDDVRDAIDSGMDAHIAKPVQIDTLKATIQQVLDGRRTEQ